MIQRIQGVEPSFKGARVNILATADNHGNIMRLPRVLKTVENNARDIFPKANSKSTLNLFAIVGDWFINPSKKGFLTHPEVTNGDIQNLALLKTIDAIKLTIFNLAQKLASGDNNVHVKLATLFGMGNHCLDAGDNFILKVMRKNPMKSLITNVNLEKSPAVVQAMEKNKNIVKSVEYSIPDDKDKNLFHKVLFLGVTIPSMDFYNPGLLKGMEFYDNCNKKDTNLTEKEIQGTIKSIKDEVDKFKQENPKGAVVLLSHMGGALSEIIRENVPQINHILNGHDHKNIQSNVGKTSINSLGKDNEMLKSLSFEFDDLGDLVKVTMTPYFTETTLTDGLEKHPMQLFLNEYFAKDLEPLVTLGESNDDIKNNVMGKKPLTADLVDSFLIKLGITDKKDKERIIQNQGLNKLIEAEALKNYNNSHSVEKGLTKLSYGNEIRYSNSYLMNYLTSAIQNQIKTTLDPEVFTVALQSSIVRGSLGNGDNNMKVMKVFDGVSEDLSGLKIGDITGEEMVGLIVENIIGNLKAPTRNTIIHWSDVQVNRCLIEAIQNGKINVPYQDAIRVRNPLTKEFEPIDLDEKYRMVIGEKFLIKDDIEWPKKIRDRFISLDKTYDELFREHLNSIDYKINVTSKTKEQRII